MFLREEKQPAEKTAEKGGDAFYFFVTGEKQNAEKEEGVTCEVTQEFSRAVPPRDVKSVAEAERRAVKAVGR